LLSVNRLSSTVRKNSYAFPPWTVARQMPCRISEPAPQVYSSSAAVRPASVTSVRSAIVAYGAGHLAGVLLSTRDTTWRKSAAVLPAGSTLIRSRRPLSFGSTRS
jgi:hypothetical protein